MTGVKPDIFSDINKKWNNGLIQAMHEEDTELIIRMISQVFTSTK